MNYVDPDTSPWYVHLTVAVLVVVVFIAWTAVGGTR